MLKKLVRFKGNNKGPTPSQIISIMENEYGMKASYWKAWKAKEAANILKRGTPEESYTTLASYLHMLQKVNSGTVVRLEVDDDNCMTYVFIAFGASVRGYQVMKKVCTFKGVL